MVSTSKKDTDKEKDEILTILTVEPFFIKGEGVQKFGRELKF